MEKMVCTLSKAQIKRLVLRHQATLNCKINPDAVVNIALPNSVNELVDVQDIYGNSLGNITVKEAWAL